MSFCKNRPKSSPTRFCQNNTECFCLEKVAKKFGLLPYFSKTDLSKQSPKWRKLAQSGHPGQELKIGFRYG
jgi:hypothetical protein